MTHARVDLSRTHTISLYSRPHRLALSRSLTESRSFWHQLPHGIFLCQRLTSSRFIPHTSDCVLRDRTIESIGSEPRTVRRTIQHASSAQVMSTVATPIVTAHAHCCTDHCCTTVVPYSTPLITPSIVALILHHTAHHSSHQPLLHQLQLNQLLTYRPMLHRPLLH